MVNNTLLGLLIVPGLADPNRVEVSYLDLFFGVLAIIGFVAWVEWSWQRQHRHPRLFQPIPPLQNLAAVTGLPS